MIHIRTTILLFLFITSIENVYSQSKQVSTDDTPFFGAQVFIEP